MIDYVADRFGVLPLCYDPARLSADLLVNCPQNRRWESPCHLESWMRMVGGDRVFGCSGEPSVPPESRCAE